MIVWVRGNPHYPSPDVPREFRVEEVGGEVPGDQIPRGPLALAHHPLRHRALNATLQTNLKKTFQLQERRTNSFNL